MYQDIPFKAKRFIDSLNASDSKLTFEAIFYTKQLIKIEQLNTIRKNRLRETFFGTIFTPIHNFR